MFKTLSVFGLFARRLLRLLKCHTVFPGCGDSSFDVFWLDLWWLFVGAGNGRSNVEEPLFKAAGGVREQQSGRLVAHVFEVVLDCGTCDNAK